MVDRRIGRGCMAHTPHCGMKYGEDRRMCYRKAVDGCSYAATDEMEHFKAVVDDERLDEMLSWTGT